MARLRLRRESRPPRLAAGGRRRSGLAGSIPVLGAFVVGAIAYAPIYCYPFLAPEFEGAFGVSRALGQMPWTVFLLVSALSSPLLGRAYVVVSDRRLLLLGLYGDHLASGFIEV